MGRMVESIGMGKVIVMAGMLGDSVARESRTERRPYV